MTVACLFPGQGSQDVGMGRLLAESEPSARAVFDEIDDALGEPLSRVIFEGPKDALTLTENAQPALMAVSMAAIRVLESRGLDLARDVRFVAGHSLGEYSALAAAGAMSIADAARLLRLRGRSMQAAVPIGEGAMAALLGVGIDIARTVAAEAAQGEVCDVANDNEPTQVVLAGSKAAIDRVHEIARGHGVRRVIPLTVSAPFHCALMRPAADVMATALGAITIAPPKVPVIANVTAAPTTTPDEIRRNLVAQVTATVRWRESIGYLAGAGVTTFLEVGAGKVLAGLARRNAPEAQALSVGAPTDIASALVALGLSGPTDASGTQT